MHKYLISGTVDANRALSVNAVQNFAVIILTVLTQTPYSENLIDTHRFLIIEVIKHSENSCSHLVDRPDFTHAILFG